MQSKLKYKLFGEFAEFEYNELSDWLINTLKEANVNPKGSIKITVDWEPGDGQ